jgi:hypothetical protein
LVFDPNGTGYVRILANTDITGNITATGFISVTGNVSGNYFIGNGSLLTGVTASSANADTLTGNTLSANVFYSNLTQVGNLTNLSVVGNTSSGNTSVTGFVSATGNVYGNNVISGGVRVYKWTTQANTAPSDGVPGDNWYDSYADKLYLYTNDGTGNAWVDQSFPTTFEDLTVSGNTSIGGLISITGNVYGNAILSNNYFYANGSPVPFGIGYTAANAPPVVASVGDQWYDITNDVLYEYLDDGTSTYWVDTTSPAFAGGVVANVAISGTLVPVGNVTFDIGTSTAYFRNTYTQNLYTNNRLPAYNMPLGAVVQTVMSTSLGGSITNSTSYADITFATVTITPSSATSKILILATGTSGFTALAGQDVTADTQLVRSPSTSLQIQTCGTAVSGGGIGTTGAISYSYMDSPGTTSAVTYKLQQKISNASSTLTSTNIWLIAQEIAAS